MEKLMAYDPAKALINDEEITFFMSDALETGPDPTLPKR